MPYCRSLAILVLAWFTGCGYHCDWLSPGPVGYQQARAVKYDPYPDPDAGPEVVGGRPREYQEPPAEPVRAQQARPRFGIMPQ